MDNNCISYAGKYVFLIDYEKMKIKFTEKGIFHNFPLNFGFSS